MYGSVPLKDIISEAVWPTRTLLWLVSTIRFGFSNFIRYIEIFDNNGLVEDAIIHSIDGIENYDLEDNIIIKEALLQYKEKCLNSDKFSEYYRTKIEKYTKFDDENRVRTFRFIN